MRILHVWDMASVSCVLAKWQVRLGHSVDIMKRGPDPAEIMCWYGIKQPREWGPAWLRIRIWYMNVFAAAKNYDIIHVHGVWKLIPFLARIYPKKPLILHYHGSEMRTTPLERRALAERLSDMVLVSTDDLESLPCEKQQILIPNPVDIEHFSPRKVGNGMLSIVGHGQRSALDDLKDKMTDLTVHAKDEWITYGQMPEFLAKYGTYVDIRTLELGPQRFYSMTALQAMSVGLKVFRWDGNIVGPGLPSKHHPESVVSILNRIYEEILE